MTRVNYNIWNVDVNLIFLFLCSFLFFLLNQSSPVTARYYVLSLKYSSDNNAARSKPCKCPFQTVLVVSEVCRRPA